MCSMLPSLVMIIIINHQHHHNCAHHNISLETNLVLLTILIYFNRITIIPNDATQEMWVGGWGQSQRYGAPLTSLIHPLLQRFILVIIIYNHKMIKSLIFVPWNNFVFFCRIMSLPSSLFLSLSLLLATLITKSFHCRNVTG